VPGETVITVVVAPPGNQVYVEPPVAVNVAVLPIQMVALFTLTVGKVFTVTVATAFAAQPFEFVPVTV